jgi:DNA replication protein DnaC
MIVTENASCERHGDFVFERFVPAIGELLYDGPAICPECMRERRAVKDAEQRRKWEIERLACRIRAVGAPPRYARKQFADFTATTSAQRRVLTAATRFAEKLAPQSASSLLMLGRPGTGKTHLGIAIAFAAAECGLSARYTTLTDAMRAIKATYARGSEDDAAAVLDALIRPDVLVLDEVGGSMSEHEQKLLFEIVDGRYCDLGSTVVISNATASELEHAIGERLMDRLGENVIELIFDWPSHRRRAAA